MLYTVYNTRSIVYSICVYSVCIYSTTKYCVAQQSISIIRGFLYIQYCIYAEDSGIIYLILDL